MKWLWTLLFYGMFSIMMCLHSILCLHLEKRGYEKEKKKWKSEREKESGARALIATYRWKTNAHLPHDLLKYCLNQRVNGIYAMSLSRLRMIVHGFVLSSSILLLVPLMIFLVQGQFIVFFFSSFFICIFPPLVHQ